MPFIQLIKANTRMEFIEMKRYLPNTLSMIATIYIIFLGMLLESTLSETRHKQKRISNMSL